MKKTARKLMLLALALLIAGTSLPAAALAVEEGHRHGEDCVYTEGRYDMKADPVCGKQEHSHSADCYPRTEGYYDVEAGPVCGNEDEGHTHADACYAYVPGKADLTAAPVCELESHTHSEACYLFEEGYWTCPQEMPDPASRIIAVELDAGVTLAYSVHGGPLTPVEGGSVTLSGADFQPGTRIAFFAKTVSGSAITVFKNGAESAYSPINRLVDKAFNNFGQGAKEQAARQGYAYAFWYDLDSLDSFGVETLRVAERTVDTGTAIHTSGGWPLGSGAVVDGNPAYCYNKHLAYPVSGSAYVPETAPAVTGEMKDQIRRALYAGYNINGKGFYYLVPDGAGSDNSGVPEGKPLAATAAEAYGATQYAIWAIVAPLESSMIGASSTVTHAEMVEETVAMANRPGTLANRIYTFAMGGETLPGDRGAADITVSGDARFEKGEDGKWYTGDLTAAGDSACQLALPVGMAVADSDSDMVTGGETFRLVSDQRPASAGTIRVMGTESRYVPDNISYYMAVDPALQNLIAFEIEEVRGFGSLSYTVGEEPTEPENPQPTDPVYPPYVPPVDPQPTDPVYPPYVPPVTPAEPSPVPSEETEIEEEEPPLAPAPSEEPPAEETVIIEDPASPLAPGPAADEAPADGEIVIVDQTVPLGNLPQTGASVSGVLNTLSSVLLLTSAALMALAACLFFRGREEKHH